MSEPQEGWVEVRFLDFPLDVYVRSQEHSDELVRELTHIANSPDADKRDNDLPERLQAIVHELTVRYDGVGTEADAARDAAIDRGEERLDLVVSLPPSIVEASAHIEQILDEADEYCRAGQHLLTLATPPEALAYRRWALREIVNQFAGLAPIPWRAPD